MTTTALQTGEMRRSANFCWCSQNCPTGPQVGQGCLRSPEPIVLSSPIHPVSFKQPSHLKQLATCYWITFLVTSVLSTKSRSYRLHILLWTLIRVRTQICLHRPASQRWHLSWKEVTPPCPPRHAPRQQVGARHFCSTRWPVGGDAKRRIKGVWCQWY